MCSGWHRIRKRKLGVIGSRGSDRNMCHVLLNVNEDAGKGTSDRALQLGYFLNLSACIQSFVDLCVFSFLS